MAGSEEYIIVTQRETEAALRCKDAVLHLSWGSTQVRMYREGTTPWVYEGILKAREQVKE